MKPQRNASLQTALTSVALLRRWTAVCTLVLLWSTWRLWLPYPGLAFPQVPAFEFLCTMPLFVDWICAAGLVAGLLTMVLAPRRITMAASLILPCGLALLCLNQHRLQPWFYQLLLLASVFTMRSEQRQLWWARVLIVSIYAFSAVGKFDFEFLHTVGQQFLDALVGAFGGEATKWSLPTRLTTAGLMPSFELLLAAALWITMGRGISRKLRAGTAIAACMFHLAMAFFFAVIMKHSTAVVLWNLQFAVQALILFWPMQEALDSSANDQVNAGQVDWYTRGVTTLVGVLICMPFAERWGWWDHWPSWALYAPHSSRVELSIASHAVDLLPQDVQPFVEGDPNGLWRRIALGRWSLDSLQTPIYPQARFELGVARQIAQHVGSVVTIRAELLGAAHRWNGRRQRVEAVGTQRLDDLQSHFLLNTRPREL
ncbi:MAG: hypothetical protein R3C53_25480 [Pirellulaceae bacterium]